MTEEMRFLIGIALLAGTIMVLGAIMLIRAHGRLITREHVRIREERRKIKP